MRFNLSLTYLFNQLINQTEHFSYTDQRKAGSNDDSSWLLYCPIHYVRIKYACKSEVLIPHFVKITPGVLTPNFAICYIKERV